MSEASAALAEELGVSGRRLDATADDVRGPERGDRGLSSSSPADVFESLLAAEQGNSPAVVIRSAAPELTPEILDQLAARVVEHLHSSAFGDDLQRGLAQGLRETVMHTVRESVAAETRAALAEAIQASMSGSLVSALRGAVNEAIAAALPAAVEHQVGPQVENVVRATVEPVVQERLVRPSWTWFARPSATPCATRSRRPFLRQFSRPCRGIRAIRFERSCARLRSASSPRRSLGSRERRG